MSRPPRGRGDEGLVLQVTYRKGRPFAAYIHLGQGARQRSIRSEEFAPEVVVDFGAEGRPLGMEIVSPEVTSVEDVLKVFDQLGLGRPQAGELAPLVAG